MRLFFFLVDAASLDASVVWFMTDPAWKRRVAQTTFIPVCRCLRHDNVSHLQGHAGDRCRTSRIDVCGNGQQETWSMPELPTISGIELTEG